MDKLKWAIFRIIFILLAFVGILSAGLSGMLFAPLYHWYFLNEFRYSRRFWLLYRMIPTLGRIFRVWLRNPGYRGMFSIPLDAPPMTGPDLLKVRIRDAWPLKDQTCNGCVKCCTRLACPLMDLKQNRCIGYDSFYWRYFNCGRYPENTRQIRFYECEKWEVIP
ncbi:MAG: hypothetical protein WCO93_09075 [bacterium]